MLARLEEGYLSANMEAISMPALVRDVANVLESAYPGRKIKMSAGNPDDMVTGNKQLLQIALTNLLDNALKYSKEDITVSVSRMDGRLEVQIVDYGIGIPAADLSKVKSALFRASNTANIPGAGLGLSLVQRILDVHGATFDIQSDHGKGTTCTLAFSVRQVR
jgi:signal transduction histidine kinase